MKPKPADHHSTASQQPRYEVRNGQAQKVAAGGLLEFAHSVVDDGGQPATAITDDERARKRNRLLP